MQLNDGVVCGLQALDAGAPISILVGDGTLSRIMNVLGNLMDKASEIESEERWPVHHI